MSNPFNFTMDGWILKKQDINVTLEKKAYFLFVINPFIKSKKIYCIGRSLKMCGTVHR